VATSLPARIALPTDPSSAFALLTDPAYVTEVAERTGGKDVSVEVTPTAEGGVVVVSKRSLPAQVPSFAKAVVGEQLAITETREYGPADGSGARTGTASVSIEGAPVSIGGPLSLRAEGEGTVLALDAKVSASIPFVGGKIEKFAAEQIERFLAKEQKVAAERLA